MKTKTPKYCRHCGAKLEKIQAQQFNEQTGKRRNRFVCPKAIELKKEANEALGKANKHIDALQEYNNNRKWWQPPYDIYTLLSARQAALYAHDMAHAIFIDKHTDITM